MYDTCLCIYTSIFIKITQGNTWNLALINYEWDWKKGDNEMFVFLFKIITYTLYYHEQILCLSLKKEMQFCSQP